MTQDILSEGGNKICSIILDQIEEGPRDFFLYAEVDDGVIAPSMVQIYVDHIFWTLPPWEIGKVLQRMWQGSDKSVKWWALTLEIHGDKFELQFNYDPAAQFDEGTDERAMAAITSKFPNLPLQVPPFDPEAQRLEMMKRLARRSASFELDSSGVTQLDADD